MNILQFVLACFALAGVLAVVAASFYRIRANTIIETLEKSNKAYLERNTQLETQHQRDQDMIVHQNDRIKGLEALKTPPYEPLLHMVKANHQETMNVLRERFHQ